MKRTVKQSFALFVVSISAPLLALVLTIYGYEVVEPGSVALFAVGLTSLALARHRINLHTDDLKPTLRDIRRQ